MRRENRRCTIYWIIQSRILVVSNVLGRFSNNSIDHSPTVARTEFPHWHHSTAYAVSTKTRVMYVISRARVHSSRTIIVSSKVTLTRVATALFLGYIHWCCGLHHLAFPSPSNCHFIVYLPTCNMMYFIKCIRCIIICLMPIPLGRS